MARQELFNDNWYFRKMAIKSSLADIGEATLHWESVSLPHDWLIYDTGNLYESGDGWYKKSFQSPPPLDGSRVALRFEGIYMNCNIFVNKQLAGSWKYGYTTFETDITDFLTEPDNELLVQVTYESPNSRWYTGAGIYRNVYLISRPEVHIAPDGVYISAADTGESWEVYTDSTLCFPKDISYDSSYLLKQSILDLDGFCITEAELPLSPENIRNLHEPHCLGKAYQCICILKVKTPLLWDTEHPNRYLMRTQVLSSGELLDETEQTFGFRTLAFSPDKGFFLNGRQLPLKGVCEHHDLGCLGTSVWKEALRKRLLLLKDMGANAIRTAHNMPSIEFMDLADELGFLVVSEAFDMWERKKTEYDYARFFSKWHEKDVRNWICRDRNRPSIIMWSIGNEIYDTHAGERGQELTRMLKELVTRYDYKGNAPVTIGSNYMPWENAQKCADIVKLAGYNYGDKYYDKHHKEHPDWIIYGSETASTVQSRGIYHFPLLRPVLSDDDEQCSSLGNSSTSWGARSTESCIIAHRDAPYTLGQFIWTGFDYIGEPTPYHTKNSYFGQIDTAGFPKDSFYIYQAEWTDYKVKPMVHLFPYWDFSQGQLIDVRVCSNAPCVELFLNQHSLGNYTIDHQKGEKLLGEWQIPYEEGELKAIAYDEKGCPIAEDRRVSFTDAASLSLRADKTQLSANGKDLTFLEISTRDSKGNPVENANNRVTVTVEGPGILLGLDNGDSTDYDQYKENSRRLFSGKLLAVISSTLIPGTIKVTVSSKGLSDTELLLPSLAISEDLKGIGVYHYPGGGAYLPSNIPPEIPIRKLEILAPKGNCLSPDTNTLPVEIRIHPENADYRDITILATDSGGVPTNLAAVNMEDLKGVITGLGDGMFYIRCYCRNGANKTRMYSQLEFYVQGLGEAAFNPYEFISASVHTWGLNLTNGNERGMATAREGKSIIFFDRLDFGDYGSDVITLPIFSLDNEPFSIEVWEGSPETESSEFLTTLDYQKPSVWNTYQEETYLLPKRLKGVTSLSFVLYRKVHLKGFIFRKPVKAYEEIQALDNSSIYGDSFLVKEDAIEEIGNNVTLTFGDMNFSEQGFKRLLICGRSSLDKNTIHLHFKGKDGNIHSRQLVEFEYSADYIIKEFKLENVTGEMEVSFLFLPGCCFDFKWFRFEE
jgi:beta-galactosidase